MEEQFKEFLKAVKEMRALQKEFFSDKRKPSTLDNAKAKEREVDQLIKVIEHPVNQISLFK